MRPQVALQKFTRADYEQLPEGFRAELIDGEILKMASPTCDHQETAGRIYACLLGVGRGHALLGPVDFGIDDVNVLVPDVVFREKRHERGARGIDAALAVFEVLSPSTAARDRKVKTDMYLEAGVREVWLVDPRSETIAIHQARGSRIYADADAAESGVIPGFLLLPATLFADES